MSAGLPESQYLSGSGAGPAHFVSTAWTTIARAQEGDTDLSRRNMGLLIQRYWRPVYLYVRRLGRSHEDAKDFTQGFFARFIEKDAIGYADHDRGRFRSFLLGSVKRYLAQEHRAAKARPGEEPVADFDTALHEKTLGGLRGADPEDEFVRDWLKCLVENCVGMLGEECAALGKGEQFEVFRARLLPGDGPPPSYGEIARDMGLSEKAVENLLFRAKRRFRRIFREEVRNSTAAGGDTDEEIRSLLAALA